jgi:hypothetical protein
MKYYYLPTTDFDKNLYAALDGEPEAQLKLGMVFFLEMALNKTTSRHLFGISGQRHEGMQWQCVIVMTC